MIFDNETIRMGSELIRIKGCTGTLVLTAFLSI